MVQSVKHGVGKLDNTYTTYKDLPERMPDSICQQKLGFDTIEIFREYQILSKEKKELILISIIDTIRGYFKALEIKYTKFENKGNLITITYSKIPEEQREDFGGVIHKILKQIKNRILNFNFNRNYNLTGNMVLRFHIRNCGMIIEDKGVNTNNKESIQKRSENKEMSIQNNIKDKNVNTSQKESVNTNKTRNEWVQIRVFASEKETIKQNAEIYGYNSISKFARNVLTNPKDVSTKDSNINTKKQKEIHGCCRQLLSLMDGIFEIQYPTKIINQLLVLLDRKTDEQLIERVRGYLDE